MWKFALKLHFKKRRRQFFLSITQGTMDLSAESHWIRTEFFKTQSKKPPKTRSPATEMALSLFSDPFGLTDIDRAVSRAMTPFLRSTPTPTFGPMMTAGTVSHPMDVVEMNDRYSIVADAPGMTPEDIKVEITAGNLVVSGEKTQQAARDNVEAGVRVHRSERTFNSFTRSFALPEDAKEEGISAKLTNGVLTVDVPKEPKPAAAQPKRIKVASQERDVPVQSTK